MDYCKDPSCKSAGTAHAHIDIGREGMEYLRDVHNAARLSQSVDAIESTRLVSLHDHDDLLDHLKSDNGHIMGAYAHWRNSHDEHIPGVRPQSDTDRELTHQELIALHHHDHAKYPEDPHFTVDGEHWHAE